MERMPLERGKTQAFGLRGFGYWTKSEVYGSAKNVKLRVCWGGGGAENYHSRCTFCPQDILKP